MAAVRTVTTYLRMNAAQYTAAYRAAATTTLDFTKKQKAEVNQLTNQIGLLGLGITALAGLAVKQFADFDKAMSHIAATGDDARQNIDALRETAIQAGIDTVFSATEAAGGIEQLAKAGVSAADIIGGGLGGALDLAAVGELAVADAAQFTASALSQFRLEGSQATHVADLLAAGAGKAQGEVQDMALALQYAGVPAAELGVSIEQTAGTIALFARNGIIGERAGTSLRSMISSLTSPSRKAADTMKDLGINVFDAQGNFIGLDGVAGVLQERLGGLTQAERSYALGVIFGNEALQAANVLTREGAAGVQEWTNNVNDQGYAAEAAAIRMDNLAGDLEKLRGSFETAFISAGEGASGPLRQVVQMTTSAVNAFNELPGPLKHATVLLAGGGGLALLGVAALGKLVVGISNVRESLQSMGVTLAASRSFIVGPWGAALGAATLGLGILAAELLSAGAKADKLRSEARELVDTLDDLSGAATEATRVQVIQSDRFSDLAADAADLGISVEDLTEAVFGSTEAADAFLERLREMGEQEPALIGDTQDLADRLGEQRSVLSDATGEWQNITEAQEAAGVAAQETGQSQYEATAGFQSATDAIQEQEDALSDLHDAIQQVQDLFLGLRGAQRSYEQALDDAAQALKDNGKTLDINTQKGRDNQEALDGLADSALDVTDAMIDAGASEEDLRDHLEQSRADLIKTATRFGMSETAAENYADSVLDIPERAITEYIARGLDAAISGARTLDVRVSALNGRRATVYFDEVHRVFRTGGGSAYLEGTAYGGTVKGYPHGGTVRGPGGPRQDLVPILASPGERLVDAFKTRANTPILDAIDAGARFVPVGGGMFASAHGASTARAEGGISRSEMAEIVRLTGREFARMIDGSRLVIDDRGREGELIARAADLMERGG